MKKIITIAAALLVAVAANAQTIWLNAGYQNAVDNAKATVASVAAETTTNLNGFNLGGEYEMGLTDLFSVGLGLNVDAAFKSENDITYTQIGLDVPVLARATYDLGVVKAFAHVGPDFKIGLVNQDKDDNGNTYDNFDDACKRFQLGATVGAGVIVSDQYRVFVNYTLGLNNYAQDNTSLIDSELKSNYLTVGVSYKF